MPKLKKNSGFSLIEILISLLFIGALVTILLTTTGSLFTRRQSDLQSVAAKALTKEIERLRGESYSKLTDGSNGDLVHDSTCPSVYPTAQNNDLKNLRNPQLCRNLYDYEDPNPETSNPDGSTKIVGVTITVYWENDNGVEKSLPMDTLISENGL